MNGLIDRDQLQAELAEVFDARTAGRLAGVLEGLMQRLREDWLRGEVQELKAAVERLSEGQRRLEEAIAGLAEAQARTDASVRKLAEAQARTERSLERLQKQVGALSETIGGDIEDIAYIVLHEVLRRELGWEVQPLQRTWVRWGRHP